MAKKNNKRKAIVFVSLIGVLTFTSTLLLVLAPAPLRPGMSATLFSATNPVDSGLDMIFQTDRPIATGRWTSILVHQSRTASGNANTVVDPIQGTRDHFVICNGAGGADGEIQINARWMAQLPAVPPTGASAIEPNCLSICLIGDFDQSTPTKRQMDHLTRLVARIQQELDIPVEKVWTLTDQSSPASVGARFDRQLFRQAISR